MQSLVSTSIGMIGLLNAGRNCSPAVHRRVAGTRLGLGNVCLKRTSLWHRGAADLIEVRIPVTDVMSQSPGHEQALAPRVFHLNRHAIASRVFDLKYHSIQQALAAKVFHLDHHTIERLLHRRSSISIATILHRGSSISITTSLGSLLHLNDFSAN
jgi:hypothetical protein